RSPIGNRVNRRLLILFLGLFACGLAYLLAVPREAAIEARAGQGPAPSSQPDHTEASFRERAAYEQQTQARIQQLARMEDQRRTRSRLDAAACDTFMQLQLAKGAV